MTTCIKILVGAGRRHILLRRSVNFLGADGAEHWVLVDWSWSWINFDVAGEKQQFRSIPYVIGDGIMRLILKRVK